jgi:hypothetical protein
MPEIELTQGKVALVSEEDFEYLNQWKWHYHHSGYAIRSVHSSGNAKIKIGMHRVIMERVLGGPIPAGYEVDHIDGGRLNNQRKNLRLATRAQNRMNSIVRHDSLSQYKGVQQNKQGCWVARIRIDGRLIRLGSFADKEDAARAYDAKAKTEFGEFARQNFPTAKQ